MNEKQKMTGGAGASHNVAFIVKTPGASSRKVPVILLKSVRKVGKAGSVTNVAKGFAKNFLIPQGIACYATKNNLSQLEEYKAKLLSIDAEKTKAAAALKEKMDGLEITFFCKVRDKDNIYGSIQAHEIVEELKKKGFEIEKAQILLTQSFKVLGSYGVHISIYADIEAHIVVNLKSSAEADTIVK